MIDFEAGWWYMGTQSMTQIFYMLMFDNKKNFFNEHQEPQNMQSRDDLTEPKRELCSMLSLIPMDVWDQIVHGF